MSNNKNKTDNRIQVIDRASLLLDALSRYSNPVTLKVLSAETNLHSSTTHRILSSLIDNKFVARTAQGEYYLGARLQQLSPNTHSKNELNELALPYMQQLRDKFGETINLTIREGDALIYSEKVTPNRMMHVQQIIGSRAPLHVTAIGKLLLGMAGNNEISSYSKRTNLPAYTRNTLTSEKQLKAECQQAIKKGYALDDEEAEIGVGCIGVLIYAEKGKPIAGLSVSAPIERRKHIWVEDLSQTAQLISQQLGYKT